MTTKCFLIRTFTLPFATVLFLLACGDGPTGATPRETGIVLSITDPSDTIEAVIAPLQIELRDAQGISLGSTTIRLTASTWDDGTAAFQLAPAATSAYADTLDLLTDSEGRVTVQLKLGSRSGTAALSVLAPASGQQKATSVTIRPGATVMTGIMPKDTVIYLGGRARLSAGQIDRRGNATAKGVGFAVTGNLRIENFSVPGEQYGHGTVRAEFTVRNASGQDQTFVDSTRVSVAPRGQFVAYRPFLEGFPIPAGVEAFQIDGSRSDFLGGVIWTGSRPSPAGAWPVVSPAGDRVAYMSAGTINVMHLPSRDVQSIAISSPAVSEHYPLEYDASGEWLYFTRGTFGYQHTAWRLHADGQTMEQVSPAAAAYAASPSPSPDGKRIVYHTNLLSGGSSLQLRELATGQVDSLNVLGRLARWSPRGDWIAYLDNNYRLRLMRPDGTEQQSVFGVDQVMWGFGWSPDGEWLIVPRLYDLVRFHVELIEAATGAVVPLWYAAGLAQPHWVRMID